MYPDKEIIQWAKDKGLFEQATTQEKRIAKLVEELGDVAGALLRGETEKTALELGDMHVVMVQIAYVIGVPMELCAQCAYDKISERTGKLVDGTFIKD